MKKICEVIAEYTEKLMPRSTSARLDVEVLISHVCGYENKIDLVMNYNNFFSEEQFNKFIQLFNKRMDNMPIAYIINKKEFMCLEFYVDENVLIPRPDTEVVVEDLISKIDSYKLSSENRLCVLDMCTGSGAIVLSASVLSKNSSFTDFYGVDISTGALSVSKKNMENFVVSNVNFIESNLFESEDLDKLLGKIDIIVSNPPYIEEDVIRTLDKDVKDYEPMIALSGGSTGMDFYNEIIEKSALYLKDGGLLIFESGHDQAEKIVNKFINTGFTDVYTKKDIQGFHRLVAATKIGS